MKLKRLASLLLAFTMLLGTIPTISHASSNNKFKDVKSDYWAQEYIQALVNNGILSGYGDGNFAPEKGISREEFAVILYKTFGLDEVRPATPSFRDVPTDRWSYAYIEAAKNYLTGYFPPNGKPTFDPEGQATREDVAVALVRALNLDKNGTVTVDHDLDFKDDADISPNLRDEVALAVENKLISGFPNGTLLPAAPVTRAQASAMVYKIIKNTYVGSNVTYSSTVNIPDQVSNGIVPISIKLPANSSLVINNKNVSYSGTSYYGEWKLSSPGSATFTVVITYPNNKSETFTKIVQYNQSSPTIRLQDNLPEKVTNSNFNFKFTVSDNNGGSPVVKVNGTQVYKSFFSDNYSANVTLKEGSNDILIEAKNSAGIVSTRSFKVVYETAATAINIINLPNSSNKAEISFDVKVTDQYDNTLYLYINNDRYTVSNDKIKTLTYTLDKGENTLVFKVINSKNKVTTVTRTVTYQTSAPAISLKSQTEVSKPDYSLEFKISDAMYKAQYLNVRVNGKTYAQDLEGNVKVPVTLQSGKNLFTIEVTNPDNKLSKLETTVNYVPKAPAITGDLPNTSSVQNPEWLLKIADPSGKAITVSVNDKATAVVDKGNGNYELTLKPSLVVGNNTFVIKVVSDSGLQTNYQKVVSFNPSAPVINLSQLPTVTADAKLTVNGNASDANDSKFVLKINGEVVSLTSTGNFSKELTLIAGNNVIVISAVNQYGLENSIQKTVTYTPAQ